MKQQWWKVHWTSWTEEILISWFSLVVIEVDFIKAEILILLLALWSSNVKKNVFCSRLFIQKTLDLVTIRSAYLLFWLLGYTWLLLWNGRLETLACSNWRYNTWISFNISSRTNSSRWYNYVFSNHIQNSFYKFFWIWSITSKIWSINFILTIS